jgi:hypothetical protein
MVPAGTPSGIFTVTLSSGKGTESFRVYKD